MNTTVFLLAIHVAVIVSSVLLIVRSAKLPGPSPVAGADGGVRDALEAAYLRGGPGRAVNAALAGMYEDGRLLVAGQRDDRVTVGRAAVARNAIERDVLRVSARTSRGPALHRAIARGTAVRELGNSLAERGLSVSPRTLRVLTAWAGGQVVGCLLALLSVLIVPATLLGADPDAFARPGSLLTVLVAFVGIVVGFQRRPTRWDRVTDAGRRAVGEFEREHPHTTSMVHLVAAYGAAGVTEEMLRRQSRSAGRDEGRSTADGGT
ncbi:TIGR04222 domain-containing membrane protein [Streptomyces sp. H27-G5]|uniref:TIGR04222 domain-containing membrane protein n=1 Tax=Streptomyces sp. H27-G5 TaxID=2996698 RepID=UPI00226D5451|nr:TIGR04222 domain-containing membrane protein [Streptomyces sp. H27-G5]MCY0922632.1 TIGR04222 domain-containing membrane protein [Streptomyces sp. H27-G5]